MNDSKQQVSQSRRKFLRDAGIAGGAAAVAAGSPGVVLAEDVKETAAQKPTEGYRLTKHVLDYYKSAAS
jgi:nitrous oxide reductase